MSPLLVVIIVAAAVSAACWIASLLTRDTSWVDRIWSVVPVVYVWVFAGAAGFADVRLLMMASLVTLWGARLTFNFARKGGYTGVEDYRWAVLRARMSPAAFQVFNLFFIVLFQNALLALIALPALTALENPTPYGPVAPPLEAADPDGWHALAPLERGAIRRRRVLDVAPTSARGHFRDSYMADDHEMVMHEYEFAVELEAGRIASLAVTPRVLPWAECPNAIASAQGVVGLSVDDVADKVRRDYRGTATCTHLNSTMVSLADIGALAVLG